MERSAYQATYRELKARLQALEYAGVDDELEQFDVDAVLNFAHRLLSQPERCGETPRPRTRSAFNGPCSLTVYSSTRSYSFQLTQPPMTQ